MKNTIRKIRLLLCALCLCIGIRAKAAQMLEDSVVPFTFYEDGDVVGFIGDSITHAKYCDVNYVDSIYRYYLSCFPERKIEFRNLSTAGYKAIDILNIYDQDPAFRGINKAVIMLGTNEAILRTPTEEYISNMEALIERLKGDGLKGEDILLLSPPICDENCAKSSQYKFEGRLLEYIKELEVKASEWGVHYLDIHTPMVELTEKLQQEDSKKTLTTGDAIHPGTTGQMVIAYYILQAQGADNNAITVDYAAQGEEWTELEEFSDYYVGEKGMFWSVEWNTLPFAVTEELTEFLEAFENGKSLYQSLLRIENLSEDVSYTVFMGESELGTFHGKELADGIDLAMLGTHTLQTDMHQIEEKIREWHKTVVQYRNIWIDVMMQRVAYTEEQVRQKYEPWRTSEELLRSEIYEMAQNAAGSVYRISVVEEGYSVDDLLNEAELARKEAEEEAKREAQEQVRREAEEKARKESEEQARKEAEELAEREAEEQARREAEELAAREAKKAARKDFYFKTAIVIAAGMMLFILVGTRLKRRKHVLK